MKIPNFILLCFLFFITNNLFAQSNNNNLVVSIGGTVWGEEDNDGTFGIGESGVSQVWVHLFNVQTFQLDSIETDNYGNYLFKYKTPGIYVISLREKNFTQGAPLYGLNSCSGQSNDIFTDNDDNGDGSSTFIGSEVLDLTYPGTTDDTITNTTFDFCLNADCGTPNPIAVHSELEIRDTICDLTLLEIICSRMRPEVSVPTLLLCEAQLPSYNLELFRFKAGNGSYSLEIELFGCIGGNNGAQVGVYDENDIAVFCSDEDCTTGSKSISSSVLQAGQVYTLWINGCKGSICSYEIKIEGDYTPYISTSSEDEESQKSRITIFPNPSIDGSCTIVADLENEAIESINVFTMLGQRADLNLQVISENKYSFSNINKGIYMLEVKTQKHTIKKKIVIE